MGDRYDATRIVPRWVAIGFLLGAIGLIPEIFRLANSLPLRHLELLDHWQFLWIGYDLVMALVFLVSGILLWLRSPWVAMTVSAAGTMLLADAWFDVLTARGTRQLATSVTLAAFLEIPMALICFYIAGRYVRHYRRMVTRDRNHHASGSTAL
jgi:hypothetical protein